MGLRWPVDPMRAAPAATVPAVSDEMVAQPKWDGFRVLAWVTGTGVRLQSRYGRDLTRYFPDVCAALADCLPAGAVLDGEVIVWDARRGRTSFTALQHRFTAGRRLPEQIRRWPAHYVAFDLLQDGRGRPVLEQPYRTRRRRLQRLLAAAPAAVTLCPQTTDPATAQTWFTDWTATGVEGLVLKPADHLYRPGSTGWQKLKHRHSSEFIIGGVTGTATMQRTLLLGRYDQHGILRYQARTAPLRAGARHELTGLQPLVFRGPAAGHPWPCPLPAGWSPTFTDRTPLPYTPVEPTLVAEIDTDAATDGPHGRHRHTVSLIRIRPDLHPTDVTLTDALPIADLALSKA